MGFWKKVVQTVKLDKDKINESNSELFDNCHANFVNDNKLNENNNIDDSSNKILSFQDLDTLIHSGKTEIFLDSDIILNQTDEFFFQEGIKIDVDNLIINGNNHFINAKNKTRFFKILGKNIYFKDINFKNGFDDRIGGAFLIEDENTNVKIKNCNFSDISSKVGGAIYSEGNIEINNSSFDNCTALSSYEFISETSGSGGAIFMGENSFLKIDECIFKNCQADIAGVASILGISEVHNCKFDKCHSSFMGGVFVINFDSKLEINSCEFLNISCNQNGGVIDNLGDININNSTFHNCSANEKGGIIFNGAGNISIVNCMFSGNISEIGGSIYNDSILKIYDSKFYDNFNNSNIIFNKKTLMCIKTIFKDNNLISIFHNDKDSDLSILNCKFIDNIFSKYSICNFGETNIIKPLFKNNTSKNSKKCVDIFNNNYLSLQKPKYVDSKHKSIFNIGHIDIRNMENNEISEKIENEGTLVNLTDFSNHHLFNFTSLNEIIQSDINITLEEDFILDDIERDFFEGGIELNKDDLVINGNGHSIDSRSLSRVFIVTGKNIVLKNIIFKNSYLINKFDKKVNGGGAIRIVKHASLTLDNCKFLNNKSNDLGGVILNNGKLISNNSLFEGNFCDYYGGVIFNKGQLSSSNDQFIDNKSELGSVVFNEGVFDLESINLTENNSLLLPHEIFNNGIIRDINNSLNLENSVFNIGQINPKIKKETISFSSFYELIKKNNIVILDQDVIYDVKSDSNLKLGIMICNDSDNTLIIEGNGHSIDAMNFASFLNIKPESKVIFKNLLFKNGFSSKESLILNYGDVIFENCKFYNNHSLNCIENNRNLKLIESIFSNNFSIKSLLIGGFEIYNSIFFNNYSPNFLVESTEDINIKDSNYFCNDAKTLIFNDNQNISIINSKFMSNHSENSGSVIQNNGNLNISFSKFLRNYSFIGGVIRNMNLLNLNNSYFIKNIAKDSGGVLFNAFNGKLDISDCCFKNNDVKNGDGGAIMNLDKIKLSTCIFESNTANNGSAIINIGEIELNSCIFKNNVSKKSGTIFNAINCTLKYEDCEFYNNYPDNVFNNKGHINKL